MARNKMIVMEETALRLERLAEVFDRWNFHFSARKDSVTAKRFEVLGNTYRRLLRVEDRGGM